MKLRSFVFLLVVSVLISGVVWSATKTNNKKISSKSVKIISNNLNFSLSPDEKYVAVVKDNELIIFSSDLETIIDRREFPKENSGSNSISWAPDSKKLVLSEQLINNNGTVWNFYLVQLEQPSDSKFKLIEMGYQNFIWYPDSSHFSIENKEGYTFVGDINSPDKLVQFWPNQKSPVRLVKWVSNEKFIYCIQDQNRGLIYGISDSKGDFINEFPPNESFSLSNKQNKLAYSYFNESKSLLSVYSVSDKKVEVKIDIDDNYSVRLGPWSPDDEKIEYIVHSNKTLWIYDLANGNRHEIISLNKDQESTFHSSWWINNTDLVFIYSETPFYASTQTKIGIYSLKNKKYKFKTIDDNIYNIVNSKDGYGLYFMRSKNNELCYINLKEI